MSIMSLREQAENVRKAGRYGDSVLLHVNPHELKGIASVMPLTVNPKTGQHEAFLPFLAPLLGSVLGPSVLGGLGLGTAGSAALGAGLAQTAATGDIEQGMLAGLMGFGVGGLMQGVAGASGAGAASEVAGTVAQTPTPIVSSGELGAAGMPMVDATAPIDGSALGMTPAETAVPISAPTASFETAATPTWENIKTGWDKMSMGDVAGLVQKPSVLLPIAIGAGELSSIQAQEDYAEEAKARQSADEGRWQDYAAGVGEPIPVSNPYYSLYAKRYGAVGGVANAMPTRRPMMMGAPAPASSYAPPMARSGPKPMPVRGGVMSIMPPPMTGRFRPRGDMGPGYAPGGEIKPTNPDAPVGPVLTPAPAGYRHGFQPEHVFISNMNPPASFISAQNPDLATKELNKKERFRQALQTRMENKGHKRKGPVGVMVEPLTNPRGKGYADGGVAAFGQKVGQQMGNAMASQGDMKLFQLTIAAILGQVGDRADEVIQKFIERYGMDTFRALREKVLKEANPGAQTEGGIKGLTGGMDDMVDGTIGNSEKVALSPGEFIVPADVVSALGDGNSDAGHERLYEMMDKVRMKKTGKKEQPAPINPAEVMPA